MEDHCDFWISRQYVRYHMVMPTVPWETLPMQDLACCDYFLITVIFYGALIDFRFKKTQKFNDLDGAALFIHIFNQSNGRVAKPGNHLFPDD